MNECDFLPARVATPKPKRMKGRTGAEGANGKGPARESKVGRKQIMFAVYQTQATSRCGEERKDKGERARARIE